MFSQRLLSQIVAKKKKKEYVVSAGAIKDPWVGQVLMMRTSSSLSGESSEKQTVFDLLSSFVYIERDLACR